MRLTPSVRVLPILVILASGCGDPGAAKPLALNSVADLVSDCGGFARAASALAEPADVAPLAYCDAEVLRWVHDPGARSLTLTNTRVSLNCCGIHSMDLECTTEGCTATETDAPKDGSRCRCTCVYDFQVTATPFAAAVIPLTLVRDVTDDDAPAATVWTGMIDLSEGSGTLVLDARPVAMGCDVL